MTTVARELLISSQEVPDQVAVFLQHANQVDKPITFSRLYSCALSYAKILKRRGIKPGEVVILILEHGEDLLNAFFGAVLIGAIPSMMPFLTEKLSPERYRSDLAALIEVTRPAAIVTYKQFEEEICAAQQETDSVRVVIVAEEVDSQNFAENSLPLVVNRTEDDIVLLQHSSGTTGLQKGVALSHRAVFNQLEAYGRAIAISTQDVLVSWLPLYHDMGLIAGFLLPILKRVPLVLMSPFDWVRAPYRLMQAISRYRGTMTWMPNFAFNFCAQKIRDRDMEGLDLSSWRMIVNCSEPVRWESHQAFYEKFKAFGLRENALQTSYAMAENVFGVTQSDLSRPPVVQEVDREAFMVKRVAQPALHGKAITKLMSSGQPLSNTNLRVLDEHGQDVLDGVIGEIAIQSDCMLTGYYNRPNITSKAFMDGWYLTGDYGFLSGRELFVTGRKKDMLIIGGRNIYPQDIEAIACEVPGVHPGRVVAFGVFNERSGTEEVVLIAEVDGFQGDSEQAAIADQIRAHVTQHSAIALRYVQVVEAQWIMKTSSGKVARSANREKFLAETNL
jgi:acyl-CoA synthetase (AMP-forming)/AMP-acid ligase II